MWKDIYAFDCSVEMFREVNLNQFFAITHLLLLIHLYLYIFFSKFIKCSYKFTKIRYEDTTTAFGLQKRMQQVPKSMDFDILERVGLLKRTKLVRNGFLFVLEKLAYIHANKKNFSAVVRYF